MSVRLGLLTLLSRGPTHGYQLRQEFEAATGSTWPLNIGQVYTTLARLERDGLVEEVDDGGEAQRTYRVTPAGEAELKRWFATPVSAAPPARNELAIKLALAADRPGTDVAAVIQAQRRATIATLQDCTRLREAASDELSWTLVADALLFAAEAELRWLDHAEGTIARFAHRQRPPVAEAAPGGADDPALGPGAAQR